MLTHSLGLAATTSIWPEAAFLVLWFLLAMLCGWRAGSKGYSFALGFAAGLIASPLLVLIFLAFVPDKAPAVARIPLEERCVRDMAEAIKARRARGPAPGHP